MARHRMTADGPVPFTAEEEAARDAEEAAFAAEQAALAATAYQRQQLGDLTLHLVDLLVHVLHAFPQNAVLHWINIYRLHCS